MLEAGLQFQFSWTELKKQETEIEDLKLFARDPTAGWRSDHDSLAQFNQLSNLRRLYLVKSLCELYLNSSFRQNEAFNVLQEVKVVASSAQETCCKEPQLTTQLGVQTQSLSMFSNFETGLLWVMSHEQRLSLTQTNTHTHLWCNSHRRRTCIWHSSFWEKSARNHPGPSHIGDRIFVPRQICSAALFKLCLWTANCRLRNSDLFVCFSP